jgi:hypothetical protein
MEPRKVVAIFHRGPAHLLVVVEAYFAPQVLSVWSFNEKETA